MKKVSMKDIADRLGVSMATVSLVLSGKAHGGRISGATCDKVKKAAEELNYQSNEIARSLRSGRTMSIGVVVTDISNEFFGHLAFYIQEQAKKYGYTVITVNTNEDLEEFENMITILLKKQIDGIIIVPVDDGENIVGRIIDSRVPMVQIDRFYPQLKANYIVVDNYNISYESTEEMIKKGCRKIAVVCYDIALNALSDRRQGCIDALKKHGLYDASLVKNIDYKNQEEDIRLAISDLRNNHAVDAIFFCSRKVFITGLKYLHIEKVKIPDEMLVLCFDKIETFSMADIPIYFIEQPIQEIGEKAVDILIEQIEGSTEIRQCVFKAKFDYVDNKKELISAGVS